MCSYIYEGSESKNWLDGYKYSGKYLFKVYFQFTMKDVFKYIFSNVEIQAELMYCDLSRIALQFDECLHCFHDT